ncbi:MAG: glycosyltransferase family 2 protein [Lachnospiraceae bacterium]|nr:glycosyltransferase family 2 protein [Lachnospiraceae bacterium]
MKKTLTIFTPTFNRAGELARVFESLKAQENRDFCWLVVDDGSTDNTGSFVKRCASEADFPVEYVYENNGGKMRAHNFGTQIAESELFVCLDSDDYFTKTAVNDILEAWNKAEDREHLAGIIAHKGRDESHVLFDAVFPESGRQTLSGLYRKGFKGETTLVFRTEVIREYLFPEIPDERYVPEDVVYDEIEENYDFLVYDRILTICELKESGYSDSVEKLRRENPTAWYLYYYRRGRRAPFSVLKLKYLSHCLRFKKAAEKTWTEQYALSIPLTILGLPGALLLMICGKL